MTFNQFKNTFKIFPLISSFQVLRLISKRQLTRWQRKDLIIKLRRGIYILNEHDRRIQPSRIFLANQLYFPSYVSAEHAIGYYDLIPERVEDVTSVTTKKTAQFTNPFGVFAYQHLRTDLFFGFKEIPDENKLPVLIAEPEKAMLDFIYLNLADFKNKDNDIFSLSYRLQNLDKLKKNRLMAYANRFKNKTLLSVVKNLLSFMKESIWLCSI